MEPFELGLALRSAHGEFAAATRSGDMTGVEPAFDRITKMLGYLAGAVIAGHQLQLAELSPDEVSIWGDYIASTWEARLDMYRSLPAATEATKSDWLWDFVICGELEGALLSTIGFTMDDAGQVDRRK